MIALNDCGLAVGEGVSNQTEVNCTCGLSSVKEEEEYVLLLTISTIYAPKMYRYQDDCEKAPERFYCTGISQLEPGTKKILYQLAQEGKKLKRIVIVESEKTRTEEVKGIAEGFWDGSECRKEQCRSAVCFYKQRILDYIGRNYQKEILSDTDHLVEDYGDFERHFPDRIEYSEEELVHLFYDIPTRSPFEKAAEDSTSYPEESLELFMEIIHGIKGDSGKQINLYIDTQGGSRSAVQQINAIVELVQEQNVTVRGKYAIPGFGSRDPEAIFTIKEVGELYRTYELVSAMTEFKQYGRGRGLTKFFANDRDPATKQVLDMVNLISDSIALCNIDMFENALNEMRSLKFRIENQELPVDSQLRLVFEDIIMNYSELLKEEMPSQFDIVEWCVNKEYYQQAITIIESKMPKMLVECGILYLDLDDDAYNQENKKQGCLYPYEGNCKLNRLLENPKVKPKWKAAENYLFEQWIRTNSNDMEEKLYYFGSTLELQGNLADSWQKKRKEFSRPCRRVQFELNVAKNKFYEFEYREFDKNVRKMDQKGKLFRMFAALSAELKNERNKINHANSKKGLSQIKDALDTYVKLGQELNLTKEWRERQSKK